MQKKCYGVRMRKNVISKELVKSEMQFLLLLLIQLDTGEKYEFHCCGRPNYSCQTWNLTERQSQRIYSVYTKMPRKIIRGGRHRYEENDFSYKISNKKLLEICHAENATDFV